MTMTSSGDKAIPKATSGPIRFKNSTTACMARAKENPGRSGEAPGLARGDLAGRVGVDFTRVRLAHVLDHQARALGELLILI
jgi:hypothetical protein